MADTRTPVRDRPAVSAKPAEAPRGKRFDIQGLRAIAVLAVVLHHVEVFHLPGGFVGVDIFFVISGFLITGHLVRELNRTGSVSFRDFYANRMRRLLPAATVVLLATALLAIMFMPGSSWLNVSQDMAGSAVYVENWVLSARSIDYLGQDTLPSPLQHFWSLAVEEQFYILWPLVIFMVGVAISIGRMGRRTSREEASVRPLLIGLSVIAVPSLVWSMIYTNSDAAPAYFATTTRLWELALGGFIAILSTRFARMPAVAAVVLGWLGVAGIVASMFVISTATLFPGYAALLPTVSTAAVIAAGFTAQRAGPGLILNTRPAQAIGDWSYSIYLWHWPLIVVVLAQVGTLSYVSATVLILGSVAAGWASYQLIETPTRTARSLRDLGNVYRMGLLCISASLIGALMLYGYADWTQTIEANKASAAKSTIQQQILGDDASSDAPTLGAAVLPDQPRNAKQGAPVDEVDGDLIPSTDAAPKDYTPCKTSPVGESGVVECPFGDPTSTTRVALVGDSHAAQWLGALAPLAEERGWRLTAYIHDACPLAAGNLQLDSKPYPDCVEWNKAVTKKILAGDPEAVMVSSFTDSAQLVGTGRDVDSMAAAYSKAWRAFTAKDIPVIALRDTPRFGMFNVPECLAANPTKMTKCTASREDAADGQGVAQMQAAKATEGVTAVDLNDAICPTSTCAPVIGNVIVYRDSNHMTDTYILTLLPRLEAAIKSVPGLQAS